MKQKINTIEIIKRLKMSLNIKTDEQLAELLGVSRPTVSSWKIRNSIDYSLIFETFPELDLNLIIKVLQYATPKTQKPLRLVTPIIQSF